VNYLQLVQRLKSEAGRSGAAPTTLVGLASGDQRLANWVADAWLEVQRRRQDWDWMRKTITGPLIIEQLAYRADEIDAEAELVARWMPETDDYTVRVQGPGAERPGDLCQLDYEDFQARYIARTATPGAPQYWAEGLDKKLLVGPAPDIDGYILSADYMARPTALTADDSIPGMPEEFHMLLVWRALVEVGGFDGAPEVEARGRKNTRMAWIDLLDSQAPRLQLTDEVLC